MASKKSPNFTELQKTVLIELVDSRNRIIERKQNDDSAVFNLGLSRGYLIARSTGKSELPELDVRKWPLVNNHFQCLKS
jgi:hypothetical protein